MIDYRLSQGNKNYIFFLHGWGGDKNSFKCVENYIELDFNMVFISFSGFGASAVPQKPYKLEDYVHELYELIKHVYDDGKVYFVCHSFGARVAALFIKMFPNIVDRLIIVDGAGVKPRRSLLYYLKVRRYKRKKKLVSKGKLSAGALDKYGSSDYKVLSPIMKRTFINVVNKDLKNEIKSISCPTLIYWGKEDKDTPLYMARKMHRWIKNSKLVVREGCGHFSYIDDIYFFVKTIEKFLCD